MREWIQRWTDWGVFIWGLGILGCSPAEPGPSSRRAPEKVGAFGMDAYCRLAADPQVVELSHKLAVSCQRSMGPTDLDEDNFPRCRILLPDERGGLRGRSIEGAITALALPDGGLVVLTSDERLVLHDGRRIVREIASWAAEPDVDRSGRFVAFVGFSGEERPDLGDPTHIAVVDLQRGERRVVVDDPNASSPLFTPDGQSLLFVTAASGVASIARISLAGGSVELLTNQGLEDTGQGFVPPYERQRVWIGDTLVYSFIGEGNQAEVWAFSLATSFASRIGRGVFPVPAEGGKVAVRDEVSGRCPVLLGLGGEP